MKASLMIGILSLMISQTSYAQTETYTGFGAQTEYGVETCGVIVETKNDNTADLQIVALGEVVELNVAQNGEFSKAALTASSELMAKVSGEMKDGKPLSFTIKVYENKLFGQQMTCTIE